MIIQPELMNYLITAVFLEQPLASPGCAKQCGSFLEHKARCLETRACDMHVHGGSLNFLLNKHNNEIIQKVYVAQKK